MDIYSSKLSPVLDIGVGVFLIVIGKFVGFFSFFFFDVTSFAVWTVFESYAIAVFVMSKAGSFKGFEGSHSNFKVLLTPEIVLVPHHPPHLETV